MLQNSVQTIVLRGYDFLKISPLPANLPTEFQYVTHTGTYLGQIWVAQVGPTLIWPPAINGSTWAAQQMGPMCAVCGQAVQAIF